MLLELLRLSPAAVRRRPTRCRADYLVDSGSSVQLNQNCKEVPANQVIEANSTEAQSSPPPKRRLHSLDHERRSDPRKERHTLEVSHGFSLKKSVNAEVYIPDLAESESC